MKPIFLLLMSLVCVLTSVGQISGASAKVIAVYSAAEIEAMDANQIEKLNFMADNLCIIQTNNEKTASLPEMVLQNSDGTTFLGEINTENFNPLLFGITPMQDQNQYFSIDNGTKSLFVYSQARLDVLFQRNQLNKN